jgi:hypothetical protein
VSPAIVQRLFKKRLRPGLGAPMEKAPDIRRWLVTYGRAGASFVRTFKDKDSARAYADRCTKLGWSAKVTKPKP